MDRTVLEKCIKTYGTRFSRRQKERSTEALHQDFHTLGYEPTMIKGRKLLSHMHNYLYGNMKQTKAAIVVLYSTPEREFWKKVLYFPFDGTKTVDKTAMVTYVPIFPFLTLIFGGLYGLWPLITSMRLASLISCGLFLLAAMLMYWVMHGFYNTYNCSRDSATIVAAVEIAKGLDRDECKKVGFLFTGKNKTRFIDAEVAAKDLVNTGKDPMLTRLDCIAKGSVVQIGFNPQNYKLANKIAKYHPKKKSIDVIKLNEEMRTQNAMACFKKAAIISYGKLGDAGSLCAIGTDIGKDRDIGLETPDGNIIMVKGCLHNRK